MFQVVGSLCRTLQKESMMLRCYIGVIKRRTTLKQIPGSAPGFFVDFEPGSRIQRRLIFTRRGSSSAKILEKVFNYAFSHGIKQLEANIGNSRNHTWPLPVGRNTSFESLTSLKLQSDVAINCQFLGPRFENLTVLYLKRVIVTDEEPFLGFPMLEKLTLLNCDIIGQTLRIHSRNLSDLSISGHQSLKSCELTTPRLRFFGYRGVDFPIIQTREQGLPLLDTIVIDFNGYCNHIHEKKTFDDLLSLFCALPDATSLTLYCSTIEILCFFQHELVKQRSPFRNLKCLKLDFRKSEYQAHRPPVYEESFEIPSDVKDYLLHNSPNAKVTRIDSEYWKYRVVDDIDLDYYTYWEFRIVDDIEGDYWMVKDILFSGDIF